MLLTKLTLGQLYCECFAAEIFCQENFCRCTQCSNTPSFSFERDAAIRRIKNNPALRDSSGTKRQAWAQGSSGIAPNLALLGQTTFSCKCRKGCLKKYCECFEHGQLCQEGCECQKCSNFLGSDDLVSKRHSMKDFDGVAKVS